MQILTQIQAPNLNFTSSGIPTLSVPLTEVDSGSSTESDFYLSGVVANSLGVGIEGVSVTFSNGGSVITGGMGAFSRRLPSGWSGTILPTKDGHTFSPVNEVVSSLTEDQLAINFSGTRSNVLFVDSSTTGSGDGSSWANAFVDLGDALRSTLPYDEIWVVQGTYKPGLVRSSKYIIPPGKEVYGGFTGNETQRSQRDPTLNETILSGDIGVEDDSSDNTYHVVKPLQNALLDGFTISNGHASENFGEGDDRGKGAGLFADSTSFTVANCTFSNNAAQQGGGGVYLKESNASFVSCSFVNNSASNIGSGGGVLIEDSNASFQSSSFSANTSGYRGGAMRWTDSVGTVADTNLSQNLNTLANGAGAVFLDKSPVSFENCLFQENSTQANNYGGAVKLSSSSANFPVVHLCVIAIRKTQVVQSMWIAIPHRHLLTTNLIIIRLRRTVEPFFRKVHFLSMVACFWAILLTWVEVFPAPDQ